MNILEILLGQIPEAIYFVLFIIYTKQLTNRRILFISIMTVEYVLLFSTLRYNSYAHLLFFVLTYCVMKILYKNKCQITDIFTLSIAGILLIITSAVMFPLVYVFENNYILYVIINRIILFSILFLLKHKLCNIQKLYKYLWNRNDRLKRRMKSTTFRSLNVVLFNIMFYIINLGMIYVLLLRR